MFKLGSSVDRAMTKNISRGLKMSGFFSLNKHSIEFLHKGEHIGPGG